jgi:hypothetical protein
VSVVIILAALVFLGGIVAVATGRGGELARDVVDPPVADFESAADVARYRPPPALLGYDPGATEFALLQAGRALADRDAQIAWLRGRLRELQPEGERQGGVLQGLADQDESPAEQGSEPESARPATSVAQAARTGDDA